MTGIARDDLAAAVSKARWRLLPLLAIGYLFAYIDRVNVSFASTQMNVDLGFSATIYGFGAGLFYLAYAMVEIPSNALLVRFGARVWLARIMIMWGALSCCMMFVKLPWHFYALRFLLGLAEAGFFPGVIYYLSLWFPTRQRGKALGMFYVANPLAVFVMGFISKPLLALDGIAALRGWQWMFLLQGLPPVLIGLALLLFLPDRPDDVRWLDESERTSLQRAVAEHPVAHEPHGAHDFLSILADRRVVLLTAIYLLTLASSTTFTLSAPAILMERTGWTLGPVGTLIAMGGLTAAAFMLIGGWITDHRGERFTVLYTALCFDVLGYGLVIVAPAPWLVAAGVILSQIGRGAHSTAQVALWSDLLRDRRMAIGTAAISSIANVGVWLLPIGFGWARDATGTYTAGLWAIPAMNLLAILATLALRRTARTRAAA